MSRAHSRQLQDIDLKLLRIFKVIVECGGFSAAQYELNMSLSAISAAMSQLEDRVGFKLCERGRGGFSLTEGGVLIQRETNALLQSLDGFQAAVSEFVGEMPGSVHIAIDDAILTNFRCPLHKIIRRFAQSAPKLNLDIAISTPPQMEKSLLSNELNIAVGPFREVSSALDCKQLYEEKQFLCCGKGHPAFGENEAEKIDRLLAHSSYAARSLKDEAATLDETQFSRSAITSQMEALLALVLSGQYLGYLPRHACENWIDQGELWALNSEKYAYQVPISVVYKKSHNDPRVALFLDAVAQLS